MLFRSYEAAALMAAARWAAEGAHDPMPEDAAQQLRQILESYDQALAGLKRNSSALGSAAQGRRG